MIANGIKTRKGSGKNKAQLKRLTRYAKINARKAKVKAESKQ